MASILVVEDETDLNHLVAQQLRQEGYEVLQAFDGKAAVEAVAANRLDLVILDWMLPELDGLAVCRTIRQHHLVPILMLTARGEEADIVLALEVGADDYLVKPFRLRELMARVRAMLRRASQIEAPERVQATGGPAFARAGAISVDHESRTATVAGRELELTQKEFELLALFVQHPGRAFSRDFLLETIWSADYEVTDRTVDTHVQRLRKKLADEAGAIRTVWGIGYKLQPRPLP